MSGWSVSGGRGGGSGTPGASTSDQLTDTRTGRPLTESLDASDESVAAAVAASDAAGTKAEQARAAAAAVDERVDAISVSASQPTSTTNGGSWTSTFNG